MHRWVELFPVSASPHADSVDHLFWFLMIVAGFFGFLILVLILTFSIRYRRSRHPVAEPTKSSIGLELFWTAVPFAIALVIFVWGSKVYMDGETPPQGAQDMYVVGKQWMWKIQHPEWPARDQRTARSCWTPHQGDPGFAGCDPQFFHSGVSHQAGRRPGRISDDVVPADAAGRIPLVLCRILRHGSLAK